MPAITPDSGSRRAAPARACALAVLRRVFEDGAWADRALHAEAQRLALEPRDRALAMRLAYGAVQRRATLDHVIEVLAGRPVGGLEPLVLAGLRLGLYQLAYLERVPAARGRRRRGRARQGRARPAAPGSSTPCCAAARARRAGASRPCPDGTPAEAALRHSHPEWIAALWFATLGPDAARALLAADNEPAESALRANTLRTDARALAAPAAGPRPPGAPGCPRAWCSTARSTPSARRCGRRACFMPQSRAAMTVARRARPAARASGCSTCAPRPAARRRTWPR